MGIGIIVNVCEVKKECIHVKQEFLQGVKTRLSIRKGRTYDWPRKNPFVTVKAVNWGEKVSECQRGVKVNNNR